MLRPGHLALLLVIAAACSAAEPIVERGVVYGTVEGVDLLLDCARPADDGPHPGIVMIHGGGWSGGGRAAYAAAIVMYARRGYVAATVDYRLAPKFRHPAQVEDTRRAVRWLRGQAGRLHLDPERVGAFGESAGGHLALMLGLMDGADAGEPLSSKVQVVVNGFGPTDLTVASLHTRQVDRILDAFLGTADPAAEIARAASPVTYIDARDPPVLTLHGAKDELVPVAQARELHERLRAAGVEERLEVFDGAGHGFAGMDAARALGAAIGFFDEHLMPRKDAAASP